MKIIKYLSFIAIAFLVLIGGLVATLNSIDLNQYKGTLEKQFTELIGREITHLKGESELGVSLRPRILLRDVRLKNAPWGSQHGSLAEAATNPLANLVQFQLQNQYNWDVDNDELKSVYEEFLLQRAMQSYMMTLPTLNVIGTPPAARLLICTGPSGGSSS
jgi:hypothetical protein